jgi:hypothetical protein
VRRGLLVLVVVPVLAVGVFVIVPCHDSEFTEGRRRRRL